MPPTPVPAIKVGHIHDVQELGKNKSSEIPERFIRDTFERPSLEQPISYDNNIPIIDFSKLVKGNKDDDDFCTEIMKLTTACQEWGFFQVMNHGIEVELLDKIEKVAMEFFNMPLEEKKRYPMAPGTVQGYGQAFIFSEDQKLDWCNMFALGLEPKSVRNPKLWPTKPSDFSETLEIYSREIRKLCKNLLKCIATTLSLKDDVFEEMFGETVQAVRMNYYPACPRPDLVLGLSPHSDGSAITVLQQGKGNPIGLQILKDNGWVSVQPIPNALVINIGDTLEVLTNGRYKSVEHRAVANKEKDRLSIVTFYAPNYEMEVGPMKEMVDDNNPCKYRRYNHGEYNKHYVTSKLEGKKTLEFAKIINK
ncbi:2-oxoglutarate (2OG) and Fe(II)-dependent oxygenase superfamily protein [Striga asiatica]|uniref:2-oxoglutarate (2OG) and Fe(II)-dependent oxygenase superfamily protein n=1 Tax=Striga asiatica TaxID=4170 RepID=A0A5A7RFH2_STRAF|nr:2-oxoglutarate (2OG) and Fe(II)-dependent oxygenase superfamily protein [Striga asiatica]